MASQISKTIEGCDATLKAPADQLRMALEDVQAMTATLTGYLMAASEQPTEIYKIGLASVRFLLAVGDLIIGWRLLVAADVAHAALASGPQRRRGVLSGQDRDGCVLRLKHAAQHHGGARHRRSIDDDIMRLSEAAF